MDALTTAEISAMLESDDIPQAPYTRRTLLNENNRRAMEKGRQIALQEKRCVEFIQVIQERAAFAKSSCRTCARHITHHTYF
jgi:hypothetical protein